MNHYWRCCCYETAKQCTLSERSQENFNEGHCSKCCGRLKGGKGQHSERQIVKHLKIVVTVPVAGKDIFLNMACVLSSLLKKMEDKCAIRSLKPSCNNWHIHSLCFALFQKIAMHCPAKLFPCLHQFCCRELLLFFG